MSKALNRLTAVLVATSLIIFVTQSGFAQITEGRTIDDFLRLHGNELERTSSVAFYYYFTGKSRASLEQFWRLLKHFILEAEAHPEVRGLGSGVLKLAACICKYGHAEDFDRLVDVYAKLPRESVLRRWLATPLSEYWIRREIQRAQFPAIAFSSVSINPTNSLKDASTDLQECWRKYKAVTQTFDREFVPPANNSGFAIESNSPLYYDALGELLRGRAGEAVAKLKANHWGGWRRTNREWLRPLQFYVIFMMLLQEQKYPLAVAAIFEHCGEEELFEMFIEGRYESRQRLITGCGLDWESLYAGAAADGRFDLFGWLLAHNGSARSAEYLLAMQSLPHLQRSRTYLDTLAMFITPGYQNARPARAGQGAAALDLQLKLLEVICSRVHRDDDQSSAEHIAGILEQLRRPESRNALLQQLTSPYEKVRASAARTLRALGETVVLNEEVSRPVEFRLAVDGEALANTKIHWNLVRGASTNYARVSSSQHTDAQAHFRISREYFLDPKNKVTTILVHADYPNSAKDLWFSTRRDLPAELDSPIDIAIRTTSLTLQLATDQLRPFPTNAQMLVQLKGQKWVSANFAYHSTISMLGSNGFLMAVAPKVVFPALGLDKYKIELHVPGAKRWESGIIDLEKSSEPVTAQLELGADLKFAFLAPGGDFRDKQPKAIILQDGKPVNLSRYYDFFTKMYRGLPAGQYTLKVLSSAEKRTDLESKKRRAPSHPKYKALEKSFTIDQNSSPLIDLGVIELSPE